MSADPLRQFRLHSNCRSCDAPVLWVKTEKLRWMPLDAEPVDPAGIHTFVLRADRAVAVPPLVYTDEPHYVSHFSTCPDADEWRKKHE